jgi:hypothetical protein
MHARRLGEDADPLVRSLRGAGHKRSGPDVNSERAQEATTPKLDHDVAAWDDKPMYVEGFGCLLD